MAYDFKSVSILVVEDNLVMLKLVKSLLQTFGVKNIMTARDGKEGFATYCAQNPDIIIADWMMRPMDGLKMITLIRESKDSPNKYIPVIMMTAFSRETLVYKARDMGVTEFMSKPFSARDLYRRLVEIIERPRRFVKSTDFFGPDRRRRTGKSYGGSMKRETDIRPEDFVLDIPTDH